MGDNSEAVRVILRVRGWFLSIRGTQLEPRLVPQYSFPDLVTCLSHLSKLNSLLSTFLVPKVFHKAIVSACGTILLLIVYCYPCWVVLTDKFNNIWRAQIPQSVLMLTIFLLASSRGPLFQFSCPVSFYRWLSTRMSKAM